MILRRFTHHLKEQNWFAVWLDIIVVIVGIFLGMQVTEWNESRRNDIYSDYILEKIHSNLRSDLHFIHEVIVPRLDIRTKAVKKFETALKGDESLFDEEFIQSFDKLGFGFLLTFKRGAYEELKFRGLGLIKNNDLADALFTMYESFIPRTDEFLSEGDEFIMTNLRSFERKYLEIYSADVLHMSRPKQPNLIHNQEFRWILKEVSEDISHKRYRINKIISRYQQLLIDLENELSKRNISYTSYSDIKVETDGK